MGGIEDTAMTYIARRFLLEACEIAEGDITKSITINQIWNKAEISAVSVESAPKIVQILKDENLIRDGKGDNEIRVTYDGIYFISDTEKIIPESLDVISKHDVDKFLPIFLNILYRETKGDPTKSISISKIKEEGLNALGIVPVRQISDYLQHRGWIVEGDNKDEVKIAKKTH